MYDSLQEGVLHHQSNAVAELDSSHCECKFERMEGELEAAIVFAAAAEDQCQDGRPDLGAICLLDAEEAYRYVLTALPNVSVTDGRRYKFATKLIQVRDLLDRLQMQEREPG